MLASCLAGQGHLIMRSPPHKQPSLVHSPGLWPQQHNSFPTGDSHQVNQECGWCSNRVATYLNQASDLARQCESIYDQVTHIESAVAVVTNREAIGAPEVDVLRCADSRRSLLSERLLGCSVERVKSAARVRGHAETSNIVIDFACG
jgi:hypothetical protein